jgi:hypothetical protein
MSKPFMIGILVILCGLLYATSFALKKTTEPPKSPIESMSEADKAKVAAEMKEHNKEQMRNELKHRAMMEAEMKKRAKAEGKKPILPSAPEVELTSNWFKRRKDGAEGIKILEAKRARESATLPAQAMPAITSPSKTEVDDKPAHGAGDGHNH